MKMNNLTTANVQGTESSGNEELEALADIHCDYMDDLCDWLDDENVNWKEKVDRILEEWKKTDGLKLISNENIFIPIKDLFDVKTICDESDYRDYETDAVMNSFCVQRLRFDESYSPRTRIDKFSAVIYILEDGRFFIHHNYKDKALLDNAIGLNFISDFITEEYSDMLWFLLFSKDAIDKISSGIDNIKSFIGACENNVSINRNIISFSNQNIELKFTEAPKIDSLIEIADSIYKMKEIYESKE